MKNLYYFSILNALGAYCGPHCKACHNISPTTQQEGGNYAASNYHLAPHQGRSWVLEARVHISASGASEKIFTPFYTFTNDGA